MLAAMTPSLELSGSIPLGILGYHLNPVATIIVSLVGIMIPVVVMVLALGPITNWLRARSKMLDRFFGWLFNRTYHKHSQSFERWGSVALLLFTAIPLPLPLSGGWTGAILAYLFGIKPINAIAYIFAGLTVGAVLVGLLVVGGNQLIQ